MYVHVCMYVHTVYPGTQSPLLTSSPPPRYLVTTFVPKKESYAPSILFYLVPGIAVQFIPGTTR